MKYLTLTLCLAAALGLSACGTSSTYDSGASYASGRTAGNVDQAATAETDTAFKAQMNK
jgi:hypothetical protein